MAEITPFRPKTPEKPVPEAIWVCNCGCRTFELYANGDTQCAACGNRTSHTRAWVEGAPDIAPIPPPANLFHNVDSNVDGGFSQRRMAGHAAAAGTTWIMCGDDAGAVHSWWNAVEPSEGQKAWFRRRVDIGRALALDEPVQEVPAV